MRPLFVMDANWPGGGGGGGGAPSGPAGGDLTGTYPNPTLKAGAVVTAKIGDGQVTAAKVAADVATQAELDAVAAAAQPLDADLTAIAASTTTSYGRSVLTVADAAALRTLAALVIGTDVQAHDADLDSIAALSTTSYGRSVLTQANAAALRTLAGLVIGTDVDAFGAAAAALTTAEAYTDTETARASAAEALLAPKASPALTGTPTAPTQTAADNSTRLATTAYADGAVSTEASARSSADALLAPLASPTFTGSPAATTAAQDTSSTRIATTAFVVQQAATTTPIVDGSGAAGTSLRYARGDHVHPTDTSRAPLASPTLTGTPAAPTAAVDTNTTQLATTAFVLAQAASATPIIDGSATVGTSTRYARGDHVHPTDTSRAALASPTLTGTPAAPTATVDTNTTQLATTAFVLAQAASATPLIDGSATVGTSTRFARGDHVHPTDSTRAPLASPTFTGTPAAPTASAGDNSTKLATTAYVDGPVTTTQQAANYVLVLGDAQTVVEGTKASAQTVTVPPNSSVAFPIGTVIEVVQYGAGQITLTPGAGVTIRTAAAGLTTRAQYSSVGLRKRATDEWVATGDLT